MQSPGGPYGNQYGAPYGSPYSGGYRGQPRPRPYRWVLIGVVAIIVVVFIVLLLVAFSPSTFGYSSSRPFGIGPFGLFGVFFLFLLVLMVVGLVIRVAIWSSRPQYRGYNRPGGGGGGRYRAFAIARERYARGEITREQYDQILQDLQRRPGYPPPP